MSMKSPLEFLKSSSLALAVAFILPFLVYQGIKVLYPLSGVAQEHYYSYFFLFEFIASCCAVIIGLIFPTEFLSAGWIMGGILTMLSGFLFNWTHLSSTILFLSLLIFLCIVVVGGYYSERKRIHTQ